MLQQPTVEPAVLGWTSRIRDELPAHLADDQASDHVTKR